jgi:undecaprenyl-diphosphatase
MSIAQHAKKSVLTPETGILLKVFACAICTWTFVKLAGKIRKGRTDEFDNQILRALRKPENPDVPIGPKWLLEVARDITALGSGADPSDPF